MSKSENFLQKSLQKIWKYGRKSITFAARFGDGITRKEDGLTRKKKMG
jgi:hypothetical protein